MFPLCLIRLSTYTMWNWQRRVSLAANRKFCFMGRSITSRQLLLGQAVLIIEPQSYKESLGSSQCFFVTLQCQISYSGTFMSKVMLLPSMAVAGQWLGMQKKKTEGNFRPITLQWLCMDQWTPFCVLVQKCQSSTQVTHLTKQVDSYNEIVFNTQVLHALVTLGDAEKKRNGHVHLLLSWRTVIIGFVIMGFR